MADDFANRVLKSWEDKNECLKAGNNLFQQPRQEGEIDLVTACRNLLVESGLLANVEQYFDTNKYIRDAAPLGPIAQRFLLNRFWFTQLSSLEQDVQKERFCLIDSGDPEDWLRCFKDGILATVRANQLPTSL